MMSSAPKRHPELTRLYVAVGLVAVILMIILAYKAVGNRVAEGGLDAPSRWALVAVGVLNALAIGTLLFIVARSLAKLYFERKSGILGSRLRTRMVLTLFIVGIVPSLILFVVGRNFINKNVERWFSPETEVAIRDGQKMAEDLRAAVRARLDFGAGRLLVSASAEPQAIRAASGVDLVAALNGRGEGGIKSLDLGLGLPPPDLTPEAGDSRQESKDGLWLIRVVPRGDGTWAVGVFMPRETLDRVLALEQRYKESQQIRANRDTLQTLPQSTFLFLTLLTLFFAVWSGLALAKSLSEPIRALAKAAQRVGSGDLDVQLPELGEDELAFLARTFNAMTRDLKTNQAAIEAQASRLEQQRAYLDQLLAALPVGVMSWRADGELRTFNAAARAWLGLEAFDPTEARWETVGTLPRLGRLPELLAAVRASKRGVQEEFRMGGEGEGRPVRAILEPLQGGGVLAVLEDLSLLAQAEKRAAWQEVARRMAHEVKNPLTPIQLTAQRLLRKNREGRLDDASVQEGAETILAEVASLSRLVDSFSRFARLPVPQFSPCDPAELLRQVAALYGPNHPDIRWELALPGEPVSALWDGDMVKRALINFVDNAVAAVEGKGVVSLSLAVEGTSLRFDVADDGAGVPEADRERLFEPYFSTKRKGTGLGLAIVRRIAQDHGGDARYQPLEPGSRFSLVLPRSPRA
ncbi:MAG: HAMP domain-containing protein [Geothrix sp.]|uniref:sensor histidine kinase n=1 Tax=Geothrix sp. TaxID=1962974 RepID=UPI0017B7788D|nr:ATP-binding protein [Geothrix sp.]NWJ42010.1 HAMP domain-containing protein [Geothrix sp.]WIL20021.1 MAG: ATP-binding protein [Geothrix sp.]